MTPLDMLDRALAPLRNRIANMIARAVVQLVNDSDGIQVVQLGILDGETREDIERLQEYGFTSVPCEGAEAAVMFVGGRRDHGLVVAVDDPRYRKTGMQQGEVALYHKDGACVYLKSDGSVEVTAKEGAGVKVNATTVDIGSSTTQITLAGGSKPVARVGDSVTGTAGPYPLSAVIGAGNPKVTA